MPRSVVRHAKDRGDIEPQPCEVCGRENAEAHHEDYMMPLEVMWLCRKHHMQRQAQLRKLGRDLNRVLSPGVVASLLGVTERTIARWCRTGQLKGVKFGRVWRVPAGEVLRVMREGL